MRPASLGFALLAAFQLLGLALARLGVPLPPSILGLLLFTLALCLGWVRLAWVEAAAGFLLRHLILLFIPLLAGLPEMVPVLRRDGLAILASAVVSFVAVLLLTGGLGHWLLRDEAAEEAFEEEYQ